MNLACEAILVNTPALPLNEIERSLTKTYRKDIYTPFVKAINDFELVEAGDHVAVAVSGGKDSLLLAKLFQAIKRHNKFPFEVSFIAMDPGFLEINRTLLENNCRYLDIPVHIFNTDVFHVLNKIAKKQPCYLCARMRRGHLYQTAKALGCNKLALGHHFNDVIETTLLNVFYGSQFMTMVPKIEAENYENIELIRPMMYIKEKDIIRWIRHSGIQAMSCGCTVAAEQTSSKRKEIKALIQQLKQTNPDIEQSIFNAAANVNLDAVLGVQTNAQHTHFNTLYKERRKNK
ncbi:MAG: tRNA 2-thiocytidine biosynthesis protein TtcA [Acholeplasmataceae bacterium]|nr:MAG: tRNA 2-thiocytidine biosynthesis protein TtcA [Acholeplasmataceae bacterium]